MKDPHLMCGLPDMSIRGAVVSTMDRFFWYPSVWSLAREHQQ
jgi:hypothetical protein